MHSEAEYLRLVSVLSLPRDHLRVDLEQDVVERRAKVCAVDAGVPRRFRVVDVLAPRAVQLDRREVRYVVLAHGEERVLIAHDARALAKVRFLILV